MLTCCGVSGTNPRSILTSNHAALVNKVYPTDPGETGPRPSHLSTLLFYANSKPQKLQKVGDYLVVKVEKDLGRNKNEFVKVSLKIVDALMAQCPATHINLMATNVLKIIDLVVASPDPDLILEAASTFVTFNNLYRHDTIMDTQQTSLYTSLVNKFCAHATLHTKNSLAEQKCHLAGLRALHSIASSDTFLINPRASEYVSRMVPAILSNLDEEQKVREKHQSGGTPPMSLSITDALITHPLVQQSAVESLAALYRGANGKTVKFLVGPTWKYLDDTGMWEQEDRSGVVRVVGILCTALAAQHQHVLLSSLVEKVKGVKKDGEWKKKTGVVVGTTVIIAGGAGGGVGVVEVLETLVGLIGETAAAAETDRVGSDGEIRSFHSALVECVGSLAVIIAYPTQLNDLVGFLVNRMNKPETPAVVTKSLLRCLLRIVAVRRASLSPLESIHNLANNQSLDAKPIPSNTDGIHFELDKITTLSRTVMSKSTTLQSKRTSLTFPAKISSVLLTPLIPLLLNTSQDIRLLTALFINGSIALEIAQLDLADDNTPLDVEFLNSAYQTLYVYTLQSTNGPVDYVAIGTLLSLFTKRYGASVDGLGRTVPFLLKVNRDVVKPDVSVYQRLAVRGLLVDHLVEVSRVFRVQEVKTFVDGLDVGLVRRVVPVTCQMETLSASIQYWVVRGGQGDSTGVAARTFGAVGEVGDCGVDISGGDVVKAFKSSNALSGAVKSKIGEDFVVVEEEVLVVGPKKMSVVDVGAGLIGSGGRLSTRPTTEGLGSSKKAGAESVRSGASSRLETAPVKFEDLKDAISIHSSTGIRPESLRTVTPTPNRVGKIDVKKLLNNISTTISTTAQKTKMMEPSTLGKRTIKFGEDQKQNGAPESVVVVELGASQKNSNVSQSIEDSGYMAATAKVSSN